MPTLGSYEILRPLGQGGMGKVYLARSRDGGGEVVVKVLHDHLATEARYRQSFIRETRLLAGFRHPHAVAFYDACVNDPRQLYLVMEYVPGISVRRSGASWDSCAAPSRRPTRAACSTAT